MPEQKAGYVLINEKLADAFRVTDEHPDICHQPNAVIAWAHNKGLKPDQIFEECLKAFETLNLNTGYCNNKVLFFLQDFYRPLFFSKDHHDSVFELLKETSEELRMVFFPGANIYNVTEFAEAGINICRKTDGSLRTKEDLAPFIGERHKAVSFLYVAILFRDHEAIKWLSTIPEVSSHTQLIDNFFAEHQTEQEAFDKHDYAMMIKSGIWTSLTFEKPKTVRDALALYSNNLKVFRDKTSNDYMALSGYLLNQGAKLSASSANKKLHWELLYDVFGRELKPYMSKASNELKREILEDDLGI